jgi:hypothetical protein
MTADDQRIAIARVCGWEWHDGPLGGCYVSPDKTATVRSWSDLPDYLNDPNTEVFELILRGSGYMRGYWEQLGKIIGPKSTRADRSKATSEQKAEAFLRATRRWIN